MTKTEGHAKSEEASVFEMKHGPDPCAPERWVALLHLFNNAL